MTQVARRSLLKLAGAGSAGVAAAAALPGVALARAQDRDVLSFTAMLGLPRPPLHTYATQIIEGNVNLNNERGVVTSRVVPGHPAGASGIDLPGLGRSVRITGASKDGARTLLRGLIEAHSDLRPSESQLVEIVVDIARGVVQAPFLGRPVELKLV